MEADSGNGMHDVPHILVGRYGIEYDGCSQGKACLVCGKPEDIEDKIKFV